MTTVRTMLNNTRAALRATTQAWHDVHRESEKNQHIWRETVDVFRKTLRDALHSIFQDVNASALFRETIRSRYPECLELVQHYRKERYDAVTWLERNMMSNLEKRLQRAQQERDALQDNARRSYPALYNHMYQIEELLKEAQKIGISPPNALYEKEPESWLLHLSAIEKALDQEETKVVFWQRMLGTAKSLHAAKRNIEKSTREGFPTMMTHVRGSLELQRRLIEQHKKAELNVVVCYENIERHKQYEDRIRELDNLGETGYLLAHAKDNIQLQAIIDSIGVDFSSAQLKTLLSSNATYEERQHGIEMAHAMLSGWSEMLQQIENILVKRERDASEYPDDPVSEMCQSAKFGANAVQRWLLTFINSDEIARSTVLSEGPMATERMIGILREIDNKIVEQNKMFGVHPCRS